MILKYLDKRGWAVASFCIVFVAFQCYFDLAIPGYMSSVTMTLQAGGDTASVADDGIRMLLCALASFTFSMLASLGSSWVASSLASNLRRRQFEVVSGFSM